MAISVPLAPALAGDDVRVVTDGKELTGWQEVEVARGIDRVAASFKLTLSRPTRQRRAAGGALLDVLPGQAVEVYLGPDLVLTGFADVVAPRRGPDDHFVRLAGRSRTEDLVDCSATNSPGQWRGATLLTLATEIAKPFAISVVAEGDLGAPVPNFEIEQGETAFAAIERACRLRAVLVRDRADGALVLTRAGGRQAVTALLHLDGEDGNPDPDNNVLSSSGTFSHAGRFSEITVKGQDKGSAFESAIAVATRAAKAEDLNVGRFRPLIVQAEGRVTPSEAQQRANWEVQRRAGQAVAYACQVRGWRQVPGGALWDADLVVPVRDSAQGLFRDMLVTEVVWNLTKDNARRTDLRLEAPEAYIPDPVAAAALGNGALVQWDGVRRQFKGTNI